MQGGAGIIGNEVERNRRWPVGLADQVEHPGDGQEIDVVRRQLVIRAILPVAAERAVNEARVDGLQRLVIAAKARHDAGPEALDQHVGVGRELMQQLLPVWLLQIDGNAALVAIDELKNRPAFSGRCLRRFCRSWDCRRRFDLQHLGAHVGKHHGAKRTRRHADKFEYLQSFQGPGHGFSKSLWLTRVDKTPRRIYINDLFLPVSPFTHKSNRIK